MRTIDFLSRLIVKKMDKLSVDLKSVEEFLRLLKEKCNEIRIGTKAKSQFALELLRKGILI